MPTAPKVDLLVEQLQAVLSPRSEVLDAYLFGSEARGEAAAHSDLEFGR